MRKVMGYFFLLLTFGGILTSFIPGEEGRGAVIAMTIFFGVLGMLFLKKNKPKNIYSKENNSRIFENIQTTNYSTSDNQNRELFKEQFSNNNYRIIKESIEIMKTTKDIDTFFSRKEVLEKICKDNNKEKFYNDFIIKQMLIFFEFSFREMEEKARLLKTEKGRINRYRKYFDTLKMYENKIPEDIQLAYKNYITKLENVIYSKENIEINNDIYSFKDKELENEVDWLFKTIVINSKKSDLDAVNEQERIFIYSLLAEMKNNNVDGKLKLQRLSNRTINVMLTTGEYIGKINVGNSNNLMQVPQNLDVIDTYEGISFEECLSHIPAWVKYVNEVIIEFF